jgi:FkbM family methyltransferase
MINWSAIDRRSLAGRLIRLPARALSARTVMRVRRGPARGMKWIAGSATHGCWLGTYELDKQLVIERFVRPGMTIYDVGAQAGFYTIFFSRFVGESGRVFAFEPCPYEARFLLDHVRMNRLANVRVIQVAVPGHTGLIGMSTDRGTCQNQICNDPDPPLRVPSIDLDSSGLPVPDLIKMDVEGAESAVLRGARRMLREARPVVFVALHSDEQRGSCRALLLQAGYSLYRLDGAPLEDDRPTDELYALPS